MAGLFQFSFPASYQTCIVYHLSNFRNTSFCYQEEKKKDAAKNESDSLLPRWKGDESADKKYYVDSEM